MVKYAWPLREVRSQAAVAMAPSFDHFADMYIDPFWIFHGHNTCKPVASSSFVGVQVRHPKSASNQLFDPYLSDYASLRHETWTTANSDSMQHNNTNLRILE